MRKEEKKKFPETAHPFNTNRANYHRRPAIRELGKNEIRSARKEKEVDFFAHAEGTARKMLLG